MSDKDVDGVMRLLPDCAELVFVTAPGRRAMPAEDIMERFKAAGGDPSRAVCCGDVRTALGLAGALPASRSGADDGCGVSSSIAGQPGAVRHLVYVGGSTYVVSEAVPCFVR